MLGWMVLDEVMQKTSYATLGYASEGAGKEMCRRTIAFTITGPEQLNNTEKKYISDREEPLKSYR